MIKLTNKKTGESFWIKNTWAEITHNDFMRVWDVLPGIPEWFCDSFCYKYLGVEFDFDKNITEDKIADYLKYQKTLLKIFTDATDELIEALTIKQLFEFFGYVEHFYASALLQAYFENYQSLKAGETIEFRLTQNIKAVLCNGKYDLLNTPLIILGSEWNQKLMSAKSHAELTDLAGLFDFKTIKIREEFFKIMQDKFSYLPMLAAVMTTPKWDEEKVKEKAEKYKKASMQDLISVFFYAAQLLTKYRPDTEICTAEVVPAAAE